MAIRAFLPIPHSTLGLTLAGFALVALPLGAAIIAGIARMDRVAESSYSAAIRTGEAARLGRAVVDHSLAMERSYGQYRVFMDDDFLENYRNRRAALLRSVNALTELNFGAEFDARLQSFLVLEQQLHEHLSGGSRGDVRQTWDSLAIQAREIDVMGRELAADEIDVAAADARDARRVLLIQTASVLPMSMLFAALFAALIMRPIRQVDVAIRRLAADSFGEPVEIQGPRDLEEVGECLDVLRRKVIELEREKFGFVRRISHELKTPLTSIRQGAELLADRAGTSKKEAVEIGEMLKDSSLELQRLIEDLLEFGKTQRLAQVPESIATVDLLDVVRRVMAIHAIALRTKRIRVDARLNDAKVVGNAAHMQTVVNNLVANAVKYTPSGGQLRVAVGRGDGDEEVAIEIHDSGPGIPIQDRDRVFEPFFQGPPAPGSHVRGTGLGLAIARELVEAHHGVIEILASETGALFRVRLPKAPS